MERLARGEFSSRELQEMRSASRSPNKRSVSGTRYCDEQEEKGGHLPQTQPPLRQHEALTLPVSGGSGAYGALTVPVPVPATVTPFKRFRADSLISPSKGGLNNSTAAGGSEVHELFTRRRALPTFQSLAKDHTMKPITTTIQLKSRAAAESDADTDRSTQDSSQQSTQTQSSQECSPSDVAELCNQLLVCSETLEDQMDALDVGSFLSWRPIIQPQDERTVLLHRRKPRIRFDDDANYEIGLQDAFGDKTQLEDPLPLYFLPSPSNGTVMHFPRLEDHNDDDDDEDSCCMCSGDHEHEHEDVERYWQVYSPPPHAGFDPKSCSPGLEFESDKDTENENPFDSL